MLGFKNGLETLGLLRTLGLLGVLGTLTLDTPLGLEMTVEGLL